MHAGQKKIPTIQVYTPTLYFMFPLPPFVCIQLFSNCRAIPLIIFLHLCCVTRCIFLSKSTFWMYILENGLLIILLMAITFWHHWFCLYFYIKYVTLTVHLILHIFVVVIVNMPVQCEITFSLLFHVCSYCTYVFFF